MIPYADVMKVSDEESLLLTGETTYEAAADKLLAMGPKLIAVTLGSEGVLMATKEKKERIKGFSVQSVDTTGAGDSFWGGTLSAYLSLEKTNRIPDLGRNSPLCRMRQRNRSTLCAETWRNPGDSDKRRSGADVNRKIMLNSGERL